MSVKVNKKSGKRVRTVCIAAAVLAVLIFGAAQVLRDGESIAITESIEITITEDESLSDIASKLKDEGIIKYPLLFKAKAAMGGYAQSFHSGAATVTPGMSYSDILDLLVTPGREMVKIIIEPGLTAVETARQFEEAGLVNYDEFIAEVQNPSAFEYRFLEDLPSREYPLEGYLFPATYEIPKGMSAHDIVDLMLSGFDRRFTDEYYEKAAQYSMSVDQVTAMASIIEKETGDAQNKSKVATVFYNRRNAGKKLQAGSSLQYVLTEEKPKLSLNDTKLDSTYNTFVYEGFPSGPICSPDFDSIDAALNPDVNYYMYHAATKDGEDIFAITRDEFIAAIKGKELLISYDESVIE